MTVLYKQRLVLWMIKLSRKWTIYGFVDDYLEKAEDQQTGWLEYSEKWEGRELKNDR